MAALRPCPGAESLAAFVDGGLPDIERAQLVVHLADCDACRHLVAEVLQVQESLGAVPVPVPRPAAVTEHRPRRSFLPEPRTLAWAVAVTAALSLVPLTLLELAGDAVGGRPMRVLAGAAAQERTVEARVTGGFDYAPLGAPSRAAGDRATPAPWRLVAAAGEVREDFEDDLTADGRRAVGVAALLVGDFDQAVQALGEATAVEPSDARILSDYAAALHERARVGGRPDDLPRALDAAERAVAADPSLAEAWFNRALAITAFNLRDQAVEAWEAYLSHDRDSKWADEARAHLQTLRAPTAADEWPGVQAALEATPDQPTIDRAVRRHTSRVREYVERHILPAWAAEVAAGGTGAGQRERLRAFADALARLASDQLYATVVAEIDRAEATGRTRALAKAHLAYAKAGDLFARDRFGEAAPGLATARARLQTVGSAMAWRPALDLGAVDYYSGRFGEAEASLARVEAAARAGNFTDVIGRATWLRGMVAFSQGRLGAAQFQYEQSLETFVAAGDAEEIAGAHSRLAGLFAYVGDTTSSWTHLVAALRHADQIAEARARQRLFLVGAASTRESGAPAAALVLQQAVLAHANDQRVGDPIVIDALAQQAVILHSLGRDMEAREQIARARAALATLPDGSLRTRLAPRVALAEAEIRMAREPEEALNLLREVDLASGGQEQLLGAQRGLLQADANLALGRLADADSALLKGIEAFENQRRSLSDEGRLSYTERSWGLFERAIQLELRRGNLDAAFDLSERARAKTLFEARQWGSTKRLTLAGLRASLDDSTGILVLNQFDDHLVSWLVTRSGTASRTVDITRDRARGLVARQHGELAALSETPRAGAELFDAIVRPFGKDTLGLSSIVVVPDTPYESVSFAALFDSTRQRFLIQDATVAVAPSATVYARADARAHEAEAHALTALVFGSPSTTPGSGVSALPWSLGEAADIAALYPSAELRSGVMATPARLMAEGPRRDVIHIAAHAQPNRQYPLLSRLLLADEPGQPHSGAVLAARLAEQDFSHTRVVVLAACDSAGGASVRGEGALSLARAFLAAGTPTVVSALGPLDDAKAQPLFVEFHRRYATGTPVGEALRQVQLQAIARAPGRLGAWAGLAVFGASN